jgi:hypothetical protein
MPAVKALLRSQTQLKDNQAVIGDKPLKDFMDEWATGEGKVYIKAPDNSGGGAGGPGGGAGGFRTAATFSLTAALKAFATSALGVVAILGTLAYAIYKVFEAEETLTKALSRMKEALAKLN